MRLNCCHWLEPRRSVRPPEPAPDPGEDEDEDEADEDEEGAGVGLEPMLATAQKVTIFYTDEPEPPCPVRFTLRLAIRLDQS